MKKRSTLFALLLCCVLCAAQSTEKIHPALAADLAERPRDYHAVYLYLSDQVDLLPLRVDFAKRKASAQERARTVIQVLRVKAKATQGPLLRQIERYSGQYLAASVQPLWIANAIFLRAMPEMLQALSKDPRIAGIFPEIEAEPHGSSRAAAAPPVPNGREPGLGVIGAPEMWARGYTGYGRTAVVFDDGQDWNHPALRERFRGLYVPITYAWGALDDVLPGNICDGHGTHVAGTILGIDRPRNDTTGVAFNANWMASPIRYIECPQPAFVTFSHVQRLQWALDPDDDPTTVDDVIDVVNNSWGNVNLTDCAGNSAFTAGVRALEAAGIAVVFSAGNGGPDDQTVSGYQTNQFGLVSSFTVGAVEWTSPYEIADFSSRGPSRCFGEGPLAIKPEVVAPGVTVRSSLPNDTYGNLNGTSMAAPHASGAVLLLKEAFPYLTGEDILLALYYSAIDLGEAGEDNTYGRGLINVPAAFAYLVDQGNEPVAPIRPTVDALMVGVVKEDRTCADSLTWELVVENAGTDTITSLLINVLVYYNDRDSFSYYRPWTGTIAPSERVNIAMSLTDSPLGPPNQGLPGGEYQLYCDVSFPNGLPDERPLNDRTQLRQYVATDQPLALGVIGQTEAVACASTEVLLTTDYTGPGTLRWYDAPTQGELLGTGKTLLTPTLTDNLTLYADLVFEHLGPRSPAELGPATDEELAESDALIFDVHDFLLLRSVTVFANRNGLLLLRICPPGQECVQQTRVVRAGANKLAVNQQLFPGRGWRLEKGGTAALIYNTERADFPFSYPGVLTITGSNHPQDAYLFFYDWEVEFAEDCGRTPITVAVQAAQAVPKAEFLAPDTINLALGELLEPEERSADAVNWYWNFGDGGTSTERQPAHVYTAPGVYTLQLQVENADGCADAAAQTVVVIDELPTGVRDQVSVTESLRLVPNPATEQVSLQFTDDLTQDVQVIVVDMLGRQVIQHIARAADQWRLDVGGLAKGMYWVLARRDDRRYVGKLIIQ